MTLCYNEKTALYIAVEKENVELVEFYYHAEYWC